MIRFDLEIGGKVAMPATVIFCLTILVCLLGVFIIGVCHYNYIISFRNRIPYNISYLPECFFPECINEKAAQAMLEKEKTDMRDGHEFLDDDDNNWHKNSWSGS